MATQFERKQKHLMIFIVLKVMYSRESIYDETEK